MKPTVHMHLTASQAKFGNGQFDSWLRRGKVKDLQNAVLVLDLRFNLVFVGEGSTQPADKVVVKKGKSYAKDWNGHLFRLAKWKPLEQDETIVTFMEKARILWSDNFWLSHVNPDYAGLDLATTDGAIARPAVQCKLDILCVPKGFHQKIHIYKLDPTATTYLDKKNNPVDIGTPNSSTFRSDSANYDSYDVGGAMRQLFNEKTKSYVQVYRDTIGHEIGHALGQQHIMDLKYNANKVKDYKKLGSPNEYNGKTLDDAMNVMGSGGLIGPENAVSWQERLAEHTGTKKKDWAVSMVYVPPRKITR